jgi:hypothetical protein
MNKDRIIIVIIIIYICRIRNFYASIQKYAKKNNTLSYNSQFICPNFNFYVLTYSKKYSISDMKLKVNILKKYMYVIYISIFVCHSKK